MVWSHSALVCGVDEVGRGCLAGPLVTAAVILHPWQQFSLLKDSKLLGEKERARAAKWIAQHSWYAFGIVSPSEIDQYNIYQATLRAMRRAVVQVIERAGTQPAKILVDAMPLAFSCSVLGDIEVEFFPFAEQESISVAAASIMAKVKRDAMMDEYHTLFPGYELDGHKGYATKVHREHVVHLGSSIIHRKTFLVNSDAWRDTPHGTGQISILARF